jgi:cytidine deaminase
MTTYWGNRQWYWYHLISYTAPEQIDLPIQKIYIDLLYYMTKLLPCSKCYNHFKEHVKKYPINFSSRNNMIKWFNNMHNEVNLSLNKPHMTLEDANNIYLELELPKDDTSISSSSTAFKLKPINHLYLNQFIKYHSDRAVYGHASLILTVKMIIILIVIYPCEICRNIIKEYNNNNSLLIYGSTIPTFRKWIDNFFNYQDLNNHFCKNWKNMKK